MTIPNFVIRFRRDLTIALQLAMVAAANILSFCLRFDGIPPAWALTSCVQMLPWLIVIRALTFVPFRLYDGMWRYTSLYDLRGDCGRRRHQLGAVLRRREESARTGASIHGPIFVSDALLLVLMLSAMRLARRIYAELSAGGRGKRVLVYGAGNAGELIVRDMKTHRDCGYEPIGFVDDDRAKVGRRIHGVPVLGTREELPAIIGKHRPAQVLIAMPNADPASIRSVVRALEPFKLSIKTLPKLHRHDRRQGPASTTSAACRSRICSPARRSASIPCRSGS